MDIAETFFLGVLLVSFPFLVMVWRSAVAGEILCLFIIRWLSLGAGSSDLLPLAQVLLVGPAAAALYTQDC